MIDEGAIAMNIDAARSLTPALLTAGGHRALSFYALFAKSIGGDRNIVASSFRLFDKLPINTVHSG